MAANGYDDLPFPVQCTEDVWACERTVVMQEMPGHVLDDAQVYPAVIGKVIPPPPPVDQVAADVVLQPVVASPIRGMVFFAVINFAIIGALWYFDL